MPQKLVVVSAGRSICTLHAAQVEPARYGAARTVAMATAISASVTVSIGELTSGVRSLMLRVMLVVRSTWGRQRQQGQSAHLAQAAAAS